MTQNEHYLTPHGCQHAHEPSFACNSSCPCWPSLSSALVDRLAKTLPVSADGQITLTLHEWRDLRHWLLALGR